jgi:FHA domain
VRFAKKLEDKISQRAHTLAQTLSGEGGAKDILELQAAILNDIEEHIQTLANAKGGFPFQVVIVRLVALEATQIAALRQAFCENSRLEKATRRGCTVSSGLAIEVLVGDAVDPKLQGQFFELEYITRREFGGVLGKSARLLILKGRAPNDQVFPIERVRTNIGRVREALDEQRRIIRENDLFFPETLDPLNSSVSRIHAHIDFDPASGDFLLFDDSSRSGTVVLRDNRPLPVPPGAAHGFALHLADKIYFGQVCARFDPELS